MIIRTERRSLTYYRTVANDMAGAVIEILQGQAEVAGIDPGATSFTRVDAVPDLRPLDVILDDSPAQGRKGIVH